jgi:hypothetical protein
MMQKKYPISVWPANETTANIKFYKYCNGEESLFFSIFFEVPME